MKAPSAPDPAKTASTQAAANRDTAITQQLLNMTNQITPDGKLIYNQSGEATITGLDGKEYKVPTFTATTTLSPIQQQIYEQNQQADLGMNNIALGQIDRIGSHLSTPFNYDVGAHEAWAGGMYDKLNADTVAKNRDALETRLANQGIQVGSTAYDDAMRNLDYSSQKARNDFMLNSYGQGLDTALTMRNQPINEISALTSGSQVNQPQFVNTPNTGVNGVDAAGLINSAYANKNANYQANMGGLFGLGSAAIGGWAMSERKTKTDIKKVGKMGDLNLYKFRYKPKYGGGLMQIGMMADEVKKVVPDAVAKGDDGINRVHYGRVAEAMGA